MRRLPPLNAVRAFEVAARHVSFTKAADELHVTHGAVSRQVAALEDWLGVKLFRRSPSQLTLTEAGRTYLTEITPALDRLALASMYMSQQAPPTVLRINAPPTFAMRWLMARISAFQRKWTDVELRLTASLEPIDFKDNGYDVAIRGEPKELAGVERVPFMTEYIAPVCHADLLERIPLQQPEDVGRLTLISYLTEPYGWAQWFERAGCAAPEKQDVLSFEQMYFALQAAQERLGIVLVPLFLVIDDLMAGRLCVPFGPLGVRKRTYSAQFRKDSEALKTIANFCTWLQDAGHETEQSTVAWGRSRGWEL
jgi:LysR family transcriptional regulator, glycine cleavage system transcriptional activator